MVGRSVWPMVIVMVLAGGARADRQAVPPGIGSQTSVVVDAGPNGVCETGAPKTDVQVRGVGRSEPNQPAIRCGSDRIASSVVAGDDVQRVAPNGDCNPQEVIVDTGADGIASTAAAGDDGQEIPVGLGTPNADCIETGANGLSDVPDPVGGDDVRLVPLGRAEANAPVIRCGVNEVAETFANNVRAGDDVQLVPVGQGCGNASTVVVDAGANGIAETRAQGVDLVIVSAARLVRLTIPKRRQLTGGRVKVAVVNREAGASAPPLRSFTLTANDNNCPNGTVALVDADARTPGIQPTAAVGKRGKAKGLVGLSLDVGAVTTPERDVPLRCSITITATSTDTTPAVDDASNTGNNTTRVEIEAVDANDL